MENFKWNEALENSKKDDFENSQTDRLIQFCDTIIMDNEWVSMEEIISYNELFINWVNNSNIENYWDLIQELNYLESINNDIIPTILNTIKSENIFNVEDIINIIEEQINYLKSHVKNKESKSNLEKDDKIREYNSKYIIENFWINKFNNFNQFLLEAKNEYNIFLEISDNKNINKEKFINDYILITYKKEILENYKKNIWQNSSYTIEWYTQLEGELKIVSDTIRNNDSIFYEFATRNKGVENYLNKLNINEATKNKITNLVDWKDSYIENNWYFIVWDQKLAINKEWNIISETFYEWVSIKNNIKDIYNFNMYEYKENLITAEIEWLKSSYLKYQNELENINIDINKEINELKSINEENSKELEFLYSKINKIENKLIEIERKIEQLFIKLNNLTEERIKEENTFRRLNEIEREKNRDLSKFLYEIWWNLIPKDTTDQLIDQLNRNITLRWYLWMNDMIDFSEWKLWYNFDFDQNKVGQKEKVLFAQFLNRAISWDENNPININSINWMLTSWWISDRIKFKWQLRDFWILNWSSTSITKMLNNLIESQKEE